MFPTKLDTQLQNSRQHCFRSQWVSLFQTNTLKVLGKFSVLCQQLISTLSQCSYHAEQLINLVKPILFVIADSL